ncbi:DNA recombination protein RmuC [Candidatus Falkowbacteria bacterium CG_4_10_14_0_2_um_filter_48_10]|uniref:DNA recombination protein RmuC n=1 Tax=Candidatus Falkowbacteria bacterium CG23_combo_of_CG06-09_8_20_14_all_49_15 TaxID=1974572 RepID=A0A2G9ZKH8_9BACT|nr:MAG: DNA recombination protein RmuC [Candidatus Falkowbacteria bacterium CG23_combo_of_CG06-09_8_20_14_all_49_15]PJA08332.1 MAG: DNA recombination protein RmuC [Candidatus Falkowbacteria bacterium CG_4_10_14_0_2_um_filter_48_10]
MNYFYLIIIILLIFLGGAVGLLLFILLKKKDSGQAERLAAMMERLQSLGDSGRELAKLVDAKLSETHRLSAEQYRSTQEQMGQTIRTAQTIAGHSAKLIADVTEKLTKLDDTNRQVVNFSAQLQNLQDILKNPKQRGVLGEYYLEETLKNVLPPNSYAMQYGFKDGTIVDAVVFVKEKIIPIDSKFSLETYEQILNAGDAAVREQLEKKFKQDLKNRIDETAKYVKPAENTMDFAFMFIPSEAIYYDLLINKVGAVKVNTRDLIEYAFKEKRVIIVSPTSFLAYLQTVLQGLRALQIEESAKAIRANVEKLGRHLAGYEEFMKKLGVSLGTTVSHYNTAYGELKKIDKDVLKITGADAGLEPVLLDKPKDADE